MSICFSGKRPFCPFRVLGAATWAARAQNTRRSWWFSLNVCVGLGLPRNAVKWNINSALGVYNLPPCGGTYIRQRKSVSPLYSCISSFVNCPSLRRKNKAKFAVSNMSCCERSAHNVAKIVNYFGETLKIIKKM